MKKIKSFIVLLFIIPITLFCSCGLFGRQEYICDAAKVESIQIVELGEFNEEIRDFEHSILANITNISFFVERLNAIEHSVNWGDPRLFRQGDIIIRICYLDGNVDEIHHSAQSFYSADKTSWSYGFFIFDEEQYKTLISDYLPKSD